MRLGRLIALGIAIVLFGSASFASSVVLASKAACASDGAVPNAGNNPGLVSDCAALLAARDALAGTATLNWGVEYSHHRVERRHTRRIAPARNAVKLTMDGIDW